MNSKKKIPPMKDGKYVINTREDVLALIDHLYPDGLDSVQSSESYFGYKLVRHFYEDRMAAELHAMLDSFSEARGSSYFGEFEPHVRTHKHKDGTVEYTVETGYC